MTLGFLYYNEQEKKKKILLIGIIMIKEIIHDIILKNKFNLTDK